MGTQPRMVDSRTVPAEPNLDEAYRLVPRVDDAMYRERTDRNIGWITPAEQQILRRSVVGIAGCGGMGGLVAATLLRLGVGEIRIADPEVFDLSNVNRQFAARMGTVGKSKALETARAIREIADDTTVIVYPQGITEDTVDPFLEGCQAVCDLVEFWAIAARILLHRVAREAHITILNCDTVGHRTHIFRFTHESGTVEEALGFRYDTAAELQERIRRREATADDIHRVMRAVLRAFVPEIPEYFPDPRDGNAVATERRLFEEGRAPIIATNPPMATGFLANHVLFHLLESSGTGRRFTPVPPMPGYLSFDAATMETRIVNKAWW